MQHNKVNFGLTVLLIFILNIKYCPSMFCTNVISCDVTLNFCSFSEHSCPWISGFDSESKYIVHPGIEHIHVLNCCENLVLNKLSYSRAISYACPLSRVYILVPSSMAAFMREGPLHRVSLGNYYLVTDGRLIPWNFTCAGIIFDTCTSNLCVDRTSRCVIINLTLSIGCVLTKRHGVILTGSDKALWVWSTCIMTGTDSILCHKHLLQINVGWQIISMSIYFNIVEKNTIVYIFLSGLRKKVTKWSKKFILICF